MSRSITFHVALLALLAIVATTAVSAQTASGTCQITDQQLATVVFPANLPCGGTPLDCSACLCALARPLVPLLSAEGVPGSNKDIENLFQGCQATLAQKLITSGAITADGLAQVAACDTTVLLTQSETCFAGLLPSETIKKSSPGASVTSAEGATNVTEANGPSDGGSNITSPNATSPNTTSPKPGNATNVTSPKPSPSQASPIVRQSSPASPSSVAEKTSSSPQSYTFSACMNGLLLAVALACMVFV